MYYYKDGVNYVLAGEYKEDLEYAYTCASNNADSLVDFNERANDITVEASLMYFY